MKSFFPLSLKYDCVLFVGCYICHHNVNAHLHSQTWIYVRESDRDWNMNVCLQFLFLLIHLEQLGNRSGVKSLSVRIRFWTWFNNACSYDPYGSCICWFVKIASSNEAAAVLTDAEDVDDDDAVVFAPCDIRVCRTWRTACGKILFGSAADGFELLISLRRFDDIPDMYASLNGRCGLWQMNKQISERKHTQGKLINELLLSIEQNKWRLFLWIDSHLSTLAWNVSCYNW